MKSFAAKFFVWFALLRRRKARAAHVRLQRPPASVRLRRIDGMTEPAEWINRTIEDALDPELAICDAHHHLWDHPKQRYLVEHFIGDVAGHRVSQTVYVECLREYRQDGPIHLQPIGETQWVHNLTASSQQPAARCNVAAGIVGFADLRLGTRVEEVLSAHLAASDRFRGIRFATAWHESSSLHAAHTKPSRGLLEDRRFREGFARLTPLGLSFDAWVYHTQIRELADLAKAFPDTPIALNHAGGPIGIGPYTGRRDEVFADWRRDMATLARCNNVSVKLGGLTMKLSGFDWHLRAAPPSSAELTQALRPYFETCVDLFGSDRCMFESNFPIDRVSVSYVVLWNAFKRLARNAPRNEQAALLHDTACRFYRLTARSN